MPDPVGYVFHESCVLHDMGQHPEQPARLTAINSAVLDSRTLRNLEQFTPQPVDREALLAAHAPTHIELVESAGAQAADGQLVRIDADTAMNTHSLSAARYAAGAATQAVDLAMAGEIKRVFCAVRPPGHHAERNRVMGFCLYNNIAVAAYHAINRHGLERVAIVDFDVHHGNGTEDIVAGDSRIRFLSTFQHPFYPGSGAGQTADNVINTPLAAGSDGAVFRQAIQQDWLPVLQQFKPQLLLVSAGFDAHTDDPLGGLNLVEEDYQWVSEQLVDVAESCAEGRLVSSLEGGYNLQALASSVHAYLTAQAN